MKTKYRYVLTAPFGFNISKEIYKDDEKEVRSFVIYMLGNGVDHDSLLNIAMSTYKEVLAGLKENGFTWRKVLVS